MIALSGATGKTGVVLAELLDAASIAHVRLTRRPGRGDRQFDWFDRSTWAPAFDGVESLYLVKPPHGTGMATLVSDLLSDQPGISRVVLLSEMGRGAKRPEDPDRAVELMLEEWYGSWTLLRPSWFMQNFSAGGGFHGQVLAGTIDLPTGDAPVAWIDVRDVAAVALAALTEDGHSGCAYTLTGPESFSVPELARRLSAATGREIGAAVPLSPDDIRAAHDDGTERGVYYAELLLDVVAGDYAAITTDVARVLGRAPLSFAEFVADHRDDWN